MGKFNYIHEGVVPFLNILTETYHYRIIYLTSRPFVHQRETRSFLEGIRDENGLKMPAGPLFPSKDHWMAALYREIITKTTLQLKASTLNGISRVFSHAGNRRISPFVLGIGNKENDALAYNLVGMNADKILLIDTSSNITIWKYAPYNQPNTNSGNDSGHTSRSTSTSSANSKFTKNVFPNSLFRGWGAASTSETATTRESINPKKHISLLKSNDSSARQDFDGPITSQPADEAGSLRASNSAASLPAAGVYTSDHAIIPDHFELDRGHGPLSMERAFSDPASPSRRPTAMNTLLEGSDASHKNSKESGIIDDPASSVVIDFSFGSRKESADSSYQYPQKSGKALENGTVARDDQRFYMDNKRGNLRRTYSEHRESTTSAGSYMTDMFSRTLGNRYGVDVGSAAKSNETTAPKVVFHTYKDLDLIKYVDKLSGLNLY